MRTLSNRNLTSVLKPLPSVVAIAVIAVGCAVLVGWALDIVVLKRVAPGWVAMLPNSATLFILSGASLLLSQMKRSSPWLCRFSAGCAGIVLLVAALTLGEYVFNWNSGLDQVLFKDAVAAVGTPHPGRISALSAINFALIALALLLLKGKSQRNFRLAELFMSVAGLISLGVLLTYLYDVSYLSGTTTYTQMAPQTALTFLCLARGCCWPCPIAACWRSFQATTWAVPWPAAYYLSSSS